MRVGDGPVPVGSRPGATVRDGPGHDTDTLRHPSDTGHPCPSGAMGPMADLHLHLHLEGARPDHPDWTADDVDDVFDASALEQAIRESRERAYAELRELAPA